MNYPAYGFGNTAEEAEKNLEKMMKKVMLERFSVTRHTFGPESSVHNRTDHSGKVWPCAAWANLSA